MKQSQKPGARPGALVLESGFVPRGDQAGAIEKLSSGLLRGDREQVLLGVTGSGKTYTVAKVLEEAGRPALVISHNKTLAAQLYNEFATFFPSNAVEYFVSYYDYYQPEAYLPQTDTYIEKDSAINDDIDKLRHSATRSILERRDVIIVASVSCIYGLGAPDYYRDMMISIRTGETWRRQDLLRKLVDVLYSRNDVEFVRGTFRVRGDVIEIFPAYEQDRALRVELFGDSVETLAWIDPLTGRTLTEVSAAAVFPGSHYVIPADVMDGALAGIEAELEERLHWLKRKDMLLEAQRLEQRTSLDMEMIRETGFCPGIENYSRHLTGRSPGEPPPTLMDYFPEDLIVVIDESHATLPQIRAMANGDRSRKKNLVDFGFRLPSAYDNRPLTFAEFEARREQVLYVSATPGPYELEKTGGITVEQVIRPTGLMDPEVFIRPARGQVDDLMEEIRARRGRNERVLVTTLTKRMAEDLTEYYEEHDMRVRYLHSEVHTLDRMRLIRDLRNGEFDALIGVNLLREGLDLPEVSLVAILDADKEGFLRSETSLIQTAGRAARNVHGTVILYADEVTGSMSKMVAETERRRKIQDAYNKKEGIRPEGIRKKVRDVLAAIYEADYVDLSAVAERAGNYRDEEEVGREIRRLEKKMREAAGRLEFEEAASLRDRAQVLRGVETGAVAGHTSRRGRPRKQKKGRRGTS